MIFDDFLMCFGVMLVELLRPFALDTESIEVALSEKKNLFILNFIAMRIGGIPLCSDVTPRVWNASDCASVLGTYFL